MQCFGVEINAHCDILELCLHITNLFFFVVFEEVQQ